MSNLIERLEHPSWIGPNAIPTLHIERTVADMQEAAARIKELEADRQRLLSDYDADLTRAKKAIEAATIERCAKIAEMPTRAMTSGVAKEAIAKAIRALKPAVPGDFCGIPFRVDSSLKPGEWRIEPAAPGAKE
jgi:hypothetical protein